MSVAKILFREKRILKQVGTSRLGIAEIRIWEIPKTNYYPEGRKFSLFLVCEGKVLIGIDNHKPKGPHIHLFGLEKPYCYISDAQMLSDFWKWVSKEGF